MRKAFIALILLTLVVGSIFVLDKSVNQESDAPTKKEFAFKLPNKGPKTDGPGDYLKLHQFIQTEEGKDAPEYELGYELTEYLAAKNLAAKKIVASRTEVVTWEEKGPGNVSGRTPGVWIDPTDPNVQTWVLGSSGGGIWRTTNGGATWSNQTNDLPNLTISIIESSAANSNIVYAGTGRRASTVNPLSGNGLLKSSDRGVSWSVVESTFNDSRFANITGIAINPANENELMVSTVTDSNITGLGSFILKSLDGGATWTQVFVAGNPIQQVLSSNGDFNVQFASVNGTSVIRSLDAGENWETIFTPDSLLDEVQTFRRVEMAIAPTNDQRVFIAMEIDNEGTPESELYTTKDQGNTWSRVEGEDNFSELGNWLGNQGWYDNTIAVDPYIDSCVFVAGVGAMLKVTLNAPANDSITTGALDVILDSRGEYDIEGVRQVGSKGVHVDHHNLKFRTISQENGQYHIFNGNDGGLAVSTDQGATFTQTGFTFGDFTRFRGYNTVEFYGVDKKNGEDRYIAGSQDNGTFFSGVNPGPDSDWTWAPSGDGFFAAWHYNNSNLILESAQNNFLVKSTDEGATWAVVDLPVDDGPFVTEVENSKQDPDLVFMASPQGLLRSRDFGDSWDVLTMPGSWAYSGSITRAAISLVNPNVVWSGASIGNNSRIARSIDGGENWTETGGYDEANRGAVTNITTHPTDENTAYALFSQANGPKILRTTDGGASWSDISGFNGNVPESSTGFPDVPTFSLVVMPFNTDIIWVGTGIGIVESLDGGATWALKTDHNLPAVSVWDMRIVNDEVVIATHGRGIWAATLPELAGYEPPLAVLAPIVSAQEISFGTIISGSSRLRSAYDSTRIIARNNAFADQTLFESRENEAGEVVNWSSDLASALVDFSGDLVVDIVHRSWVGGQEFQRETQVRIVRTNEPANSYSNTITGNIAEEFFINRFSVSSSLSIDGNAFHSPHPYGGNEFYAFTIRTPFSLEADTAVLRYNDVVIVEPGNDFGEEFFDYVTVEAVKLPIETSEPEWIELTRYDSRQHPDWLAAYNTDENAVPSPDLFKEQVLNLYESGNFVQGDEILVRFSLVSDPFVEGYGWVVDNISFNAEPAIVLSSGREVTNQSLKVYPNPVRDVASFSYELQTESDVTMDIYDLEGKLVQHLDLGFWGRGTHQYDHLTSGMENGIYVSILKTKTETQTLKWILDQ